MMQSALFDGMNRSAVLSQCGRYRYYLSRGWSNAPKVTWVCLNPSTADAMQDDPTIRRCIGFARSWGHGSVAVVNLYAWRTTYPKELRAAGKSGFDIVGPDNDRHVCGAAMDAGLVVVAWGRNGRDRHRIHRVLTLLEAEGVQPMCLGVTQEGQPNHPLMLAGDTPLEPYVFNGKESG